MTGTFDSTATRVVLPGRLLSTIARVRPDERRDALGAFLTLFGFMAGHALLETARDALFLASVPASHLPWVYLAIAVVALALVQRPPRLLSRLSTRHELSSWLVLSAAVTFAFWGLVGWAGDWVFYALYTWSGVLATLVVVRFWTSLASVFTVTQAKRVFAVIGSGSVLGAIVGSALARAITEPLPARYLVVSAAVVFLVTGLAPRLLVRSETHPSPAERGHPPVEHISQIGSLIWSRPYLRRVAVMILVSTVTFTLVDYVFKSTVARFVAPGDLGEMFSSVYLVLNVASLGVQVGAVSWLFRRLGVNMALALVPAVLLCTSVAFTVGGGLALVLLLKGADGSLRHSLYRTGTELLFVPMSVEIRNRVKAFIDVLGQRGGQALASLLILVGLTATTREGVFAAAAAVTAGAWLALAFDLKQHYLNVFRETLTQDAAPTTIDFPPLDVTSLENVLSALNDEDDRKVAAALELLASQGKARVIPALILYHPSPDVVVRAMDILVDAGRSDVVPIAERLVRVADPRVRAAGIGALSVLRPNEGQLRGALEDEAAEVRATALVALVAGGWLPPEEAETALRRIAEGDEVMPRVAIAKTIGRQPTAAFEAILLKLAAARDAAVRLEAVRAMGRVGSARFIPALIHLLAERAVREEAQNALGAVGPSALARLGVAARDPSLPHRVRRHVPRAIAAFGSTHAADLLVRRLPEEADGMIRFKILRALGQLRSRQPALPLDGKVLQRAIQQNLAGAFRFMRWRHAVTLAVPPPAVEAAQQVEILADLLRDKHQHALERLFRLLNLATGNSDFPYIYRGLHSLRRESRASSRELLSHLVFPPIREPLLALIDDLLDPESTPVPPGGRVALETILAELLESGFESVSSTAAYVIGELRVYSLMPALYDCRPLSREHADVLAGARATIAGEASSGRGHGY